MPLLPTPVVEIAHPEHVVVPCQYVHAVRIHVDAPYDLAVVAVTRIDLRNTGGDVYTYITSVP